MPFFLFITMHVVLTFPAHDRNVNFFMHIDVFSSCVGRQIDLSD